MANQFVTNPCSMSNKPVPSNAEIAYYANPHTSTVRVVCEACSAFISINRVNKTYRKHNVHNGYSVFNVSPDLGFTCGTSVKVEYTLSNS